jgi:hypothetical protein
MVMKKEKKKEEIQFNPADYDYMDDMPLERWMWEFIRRSQDYRDFYEKWRKDSGKSVTEKNPDRIQLFKEYLETRLSQR